MTSIFIDQCSINWMPNPGDKWMYTQRVIEIITCTHKSVCRLALSL